MTEAVDLLWRNKAKKWLHPEIYESNLPWEDKLELQRLLDFKFGGDFIALLQDMEKYAIMSDVEAYEQAAIIRDFIKEIGSQNL